MAIRKRISGNGPEDAAIRDALSMAITASERRISTLEIELRDNSAFDPDETQGEIDVKRKHLAIWKRLSAMEGVLRIVADAS